MKMNYRRKKRRSKQQITTRLTHIDKKNKELKTKKRNLLITYTNMSWNTTNEGN